MAKTIKKPVALFKVNVTVRQSMTADPSEFSKELQVVAIPAKDFRVNMSDVKMSFRDAMIQAYGQQKYNQKYKIGSMR